MIPLLVIRQKFVDFILTERVISFAAVLCLALYIVDVFDTSGDHISFREYQ